MTSEPFGKGHVVTCHDCGAHYVLHVDQHTSHDCMKVLRAALLASEQRAAGAEARAEAAATLIASIKEWAEGLTRADGIKYGAYWPQFAINAFLSATPPRPEPLATPSDAAAEVARLRAALAAMNAVAWEVDENAENPKLFCRGCGRFRDEPHEAGCPVAALRAALSTAPPAQRVDAPTTFRPLVMAMATAMETKLRKHDGDRGERGWEHDTADDLIAYAWDHMHKLDERRRDGVPSLLYDAADVANMLGMACDVERLLIAPASSAGPEKDGAE